MSLEDNLLERSRDKCLNIYLQPPEGLPNIGNTCHLNSIFQFLFSSSDFVHEIKKIAKKLTISQQNSPIKLMDNIFEIFKQRGENKRPVSEKQHNLRAFVNQLEKMNLTYQRYKQEDVFQTINNLIYHLEYTPKQKEKIEKLFLLKIDRKCQCMNQWLRQETVFSTLDMFCEGCGNKFDSKIIKSSKYLILVNPNQVPLTINLPEGKTYKFLSCIIYIGTGKSGHYICIRNQYGNFYKISDSSVMPVQRKILKKYNNRSVSESKFIRGQRVYMVLYGKNTQNDDLKYEEINRERRENEEKKKQLRKQRNRDQNQLSWRKELKYIVLFIIFVLFIGVFLYFLIVQK